MALESQSVSLLTQTDKEPVLKDIQFYVPVVSEESVSKLVDGGVILVLVRDYPLGFHST